MRVLYVSTEVYPALKTGGLADVNAALPRALIALGADVRLLLPAFPSIVAAASSLVPCAGLGPMFGATSVRILRGQLNEVPVYLIDVADFYARAGNPYIDAHGQDWPDNLQRFALLVSHDDSGSELGQRRFDRCPVAGPPSVKQRGLILDLLLPGQSLVQRFTEQRLFTKQSPR